MPNAAQGEVTPLKQPNLWTCYPTAVAMLTGIPLEELIAAVGHDGSREIEGAEPPWNVEAFTFSEIAFALLARGWALVPINAAEHNADGHARKFYPPLQSIVRRITRHEWKAVIVVQKPGRQHAMAFDGATSKLYDPLTGEETTLGANDPPILFLEILVRMAD